jgi:putative NIF3 family GTP cyclohydrolase 1 type 2
MNHISRREFVSIAIGGAAAVPFVVSRDTVHAAAVTAQEVINRIKSNVGVEWKADTVDTFKAGDPATVVTGVVATSIATMDVLRNAVKAGANLVVSCGPTFYSKGDTATPPAARRGGPAPGVVEGPANGPPDPVFAAKIDFIKQNNLVVWRFSDHWRLRQPDPLAEGLITALGWSTLKIVDNPTRVSIPAITLDALSSHVKGKLNARGGIRVVGDPRMRVRTIGLLPGTTPIQAALATLPIVDVIIAGEVREWESVEYARDQVTAGEKKAVILLGRILSEEPGMNVCARWIRSLVPELTTTWIPAGDPYWRPR